MASQYIVDEVPPSKPTSKSADRAFLCGIFAMIPAIGIPFAFAAIIFGLNGRKQIREGNSRGSARAWVGIILGVISLSYHALFALFILLLAFISHK